MGRFAAAPLPPVTRTTNGKEGCAVTRLLNSDLIDDDDRAVILEHLAAHHRYSDNAIAQWLNDVGAEEITGWKITQPMVLRHRAGKCCQGAGRVR